MKRPGCSPPLLYGVRLSVESRVVGLLELDWGHHPKGGVRAPSVVPVDPAGGGVLDVPDSPVRPGVEGRGADALGLVEPDQALHQRVVIRIGHRPDRGPDALVGEVLGEGNGRVLRAGIRLPDQLAGRDGVALAAALPQRRPSGPSTSSTALVESTFQATMRLAKTSRTKAT